MTIRLDKYQIDRMTGEYSVFLYNGCYLKFTNIKDTQKLLVKASKDLNAAYSTMNDAYRQIIFASQPFIFQLGKDQYRYMKLKGFVDERLWFTLNLYGGQSNHFYFHILIVLASWLNELMVLVGSSSKQKNILLEETFKTCRMVIESEIFKLRTAYKITQLTTEKFELEYNELLISIHMSKSA